MVKGRQEPVNGVRAVDRAVDILLCFSVRSSSLTLAEISEAVDLPKPTAYRLLSTMAAKGLIEQRADRSYSLGLRILELGAVVQRQLEVARLTRDVVDDVASATGETVLVGQADWPELEVIIVAKREGVHPVSVLSPLGRRSRIGGGSLGKALLSSLPAPELDDVLASLPLESRTPKTIIDRDKWQADIHRARVRGYAIEEGEFLPDVSGVGAAFKLLDDRPAGAIAVVGPSIRLDRKHLEQFGALVREAAERVSFSRLR